MWWSSVLRNDDAHTKNFQLFKQGEDVFPFADQRLLSAFRLQHDGSVEGHGQIRRCSALSTLISQHRGEAALAPRSRQRAAHLLPGLPSRLWPWGLGCAPWEAVQWRGRWVGRWVGRCAGRERGWGRGDERGERRGEGQVLGEAQGEGEGGEGEEAASRARSSSQGTHESAELPSEIEGATHAAVDERRRARIIHFILQPLRSPLACFLRSSG